MTFGRSWLFLLPLLGFVATAMLMSCGSSGGCGGSYDEFGNFISGTGTCVNGPGITPNPPSPAVMSVSICPGAPPPPTPAPTNSVTPTPSTPTITPTPCPDTTESIPQGCFIQFHAVATLNNNQNVDITNDVTTNWTSSDPSELTPTGTPGVYAALVAGGPADAMASSAGISSPPVAITIDPPGACPPTSTPTPAM